MKDTLIYIIKAVVEKPDAVAITEEEQNGFVTFTVSVDKEDMGRVIGKSGKIIKSIRNVMKIPAMKQNKRITISLADQAV